MSKTYDHPQRLCAHHATDLRALLHDIESEEA